jgi:short-subunit dehydrogenase
MMDTSVGTAEKDNPADVAEAGFEAMTKGDTNVVTGWKNKIQSSLAHSTPAGMLAPRHRQIAKPGTAEPEVSNTEDS